MFAESRAGEFESTETMLRDHSGLRRSGPEMVDVFVQVARLVWKESSGTIEPRKAGDRETYIPFSPVGTERNLTDSMFASGRVRFAFKIPEELLPAVDPERRTKILLQQGRWKPTTGSLDLTVPWTFLSSRTLSSPACSNVRGVPSRRRGPGRGLRAAEPSTWVSS